VGHCRLPKNLNLNNTHGDAYHFKHLKGKRVLAFVETGCSLSCSGEIALSILVASMSLGYQN
jgi:hypothetical protein